MVCYNMLMTLLCSPSQLHLEHRATSSAAISSAEASAWSGDLPTAPLFFGGGTETRESPENMEKSGGFLKLFPNIKGK